MCQFGESQAFNFLLVQCDLCCAMIIVTRSIDFCLPKAIKLINKVFQGTQGAKRRFPKVRKFFQGVGFDPGILKIAHQRLWELEGAKALSKFVGGERDCICGSRPGFAKVEHVPKLVDFPKSVPDVSPAIHMLKDTYFWRVLLWSPTLEICIFYMTLPASSEGSQKEKITVWNITTKNAYFRLGRLKTAYIKHFKNIVPVQRPTNKLLARFRDLRTRTAWAVIQRLLKCFCCSKTRAYVRACFPKQCVLDLV